MLANSGWLLADRLLRMFLALVVGAWVARHLGPGRYGVLAYAIALLAFVTPLAMLGLEAIVVRDVAQDAAKAPRILGTALFLRIAAGLAGCVGSPTTITNDRSSPMTQRPFFVNSAWLIADKVVRLGLGLLVWVWLARYFGPATFGVWNYAMAFAALYGAVTSLGLTASWCGT